MTSRRRFLRLGAAVAAVGVAGCGYRPGGGDVRWRAGRTGLSSADGVGVGGRTVYGFVRSDYGFDVEAEEWYRGAMVTTYDTESGEQRRKLQFEAEMTAHATAGDAAADGSIDAVVGVGPTLVALAPTEEQWRVDLGADPRALAVAGDRGYAVTDDGALLAAADGAVRWRRSLSSADEVALAAGERGVLCPDGDSLVALAPDGSERFRRFDLATPRDLTAGPESALVATATSLVALDPATGATRWRYDDRRVDGAAVPGDTAVYVPGMDGLHAVDRTGEHRWVYGDLDFRTVTSPIAAGPRGVFATAGDGLVGLDRADGSVRWEVEYDDVKAGPFLVEDGVLVVANGELTVHVP